MRTKRFQRLSALCAGAVLVLGAALTGAGGTASAVGSSGGPRIPSNWPGWQKDFIGSRFNPLETQFTATSVANLHLKWSFVFPDVDGPATSSQPAVVDGTLYVGSRDAKMYALDANTGATKWSYDVSAVAGPASSANPNPLRDGPSVSGDKVVFGDYRGWVYGVDKNTGTLAWATKVSDHPLAALTGSPLINGNRVYIGVSSSEAKASADPNYPCCSFRGQMVSLNLDTGAVVWRYYTVPESGPLPPGPDGHPRFGPSGAPVWSSPILDPVHGTLYFGSGNNYTTTTGDADTVFALNSATGQVKWKQKMTAADTWTVGCLLPAPQPHCEGLADGTNLDYDFGASPNLFYANNRLMVGIGQKSGVYHAFDAITGQVVWQQQVAVPDPNGGFSGIEWGSSYDGQRLYVATWKANPGTLFALNPANGTIIWSKPAPANGCSTGGAAAFPANCTPAYLSAVTSTPGLVYEGATDGKMRIFRSTDGQQVWEYDTVRPYTGVNGPTASGGSISGNGGTVVANGMMYVQSGYYSFYGIPGRVLLAFGF
ncbi:PQQ-binding-like beta-propeller repeat protein [Actinokineospora sp. NBRC 105648]|uniref:outer membrane protein assembly factor BamB family protein n=1 Tax=Actinokineospora sp. NBRC 105648 TaxID=3032206 RepID=UPI0024A59399|nr:PQQ-binding-like beta-propeller repeat protein [Actinokineospora sp. NBRC 105648]GLZ42046.1 cytochrome CBB3 [Actinokineospora sp. NBRC 105648]